ncbi:hypothetical protein B0H11DRAFT_2392829 [Mycena galericulata]|nr:hypothetical protein B0H11DRAFT_2392829 [Mycena galericulata]
MAFSFLINSPADPSRFTQFELHPGSDGTQAKRSALIAGFMFLQIFGGHFGIPLVVLTSLICKKIQRHPMLISFCAAWFIYSTSFTLLLYSGTQFSPEPPLGLCLIQAAFIYGTPVMTSAAGLAFVLHAALVLAGPGEGCAVALLSSPYVLFVGFATALAVVGAMNPDKVSRSRTLFYCSIDLPIVNIVPGTSALIMVVVIVFKVLIGVKLYRLNKTFKTFSRPSASTNKFGAAPPMHIFVRVGIFSAYSLLALVACVTFWASTGDDLPYIVQASLPTAAFLRFGTQSDLLRAWGISSLGQFVWRLVSNLRRSRSPPPEKASVTHVVLPPGSDGLNRWSTTNTIGPDVPEKDVAYLDGLKDKDKDKRVEMV